MILLQNNLLFRQKKIVQSILSRTRQLEAFPQSGSLQDADLKNKREYRYLVEGNYKIIYSLDEMVLYVAAVIDTRKNPKKLK